MERYFVVLESSSFSLVITSGEVGGLLLDETVEDSFLSRSVGLNLSELEAPYEVDKSSQHVHSNLDSLPIELTLLPSEEIILG